MEPIPQREVVARVRIENPWWAPPHAVGAQFGHLRSRAFLAPFLDLVQARSVHRAVVLLGPKRVGKTVLLHQAIAALLAAGEAPGSIACVAVDLPLYLGLGLEQLLTHCQEASAHPIHWFFLDEIQYLNDWEIHLKRLVDDHPALRVVVSGSAAATLRVRSRESGAGRFTEFLLPPMTFAEYLDLTGFGPMPVCGGAGQVEVPDLSALNQAFAEYINYGGYPEAALNPVVRADPARFIKGDIVDKVLLRDLPQLFGIADTQELNRLFTMLAWNTGQEVALDALSSHSGISRNTLKKYLEYLEAAFLIRTVQRVDRSGRRFQRSGSQKVYLTNPSLRSALFSPVSADDDAMGALAETALATQRLHGGPELHYARWKGGEVDLVELGPDQRPARASEVKWSDRYVDAPEELRGLIRFAQDHGLTDVSATTRTRWADRAAGGVRIRMEPTAVAAWRAGAAMLQPPHAAVTPEEQTPG